LYFRAVWALAALVLCTGMPAVAVTVPRANDPEPVDHVVNITSSDLIAIQSFYHRRVNNDVVRNTTLEQQLWGFTADSSLPVSAAHAQLEYSVWVPPGSGQETFGDERNRLVRLRLNDHRRYVDYGANFFAVGEAFVGNPLTQERLNVGGLPGPGDGTELWVAGKWPGVALKPRFRRLEKTQGSANLVDETFGLSYDHGIGGTSRLIYLLESTDSSTWFEDALGAGFARDSAAATVRMRASRWTVFVKNLRFGEQFDAGRRETGSLWEFGGTLNVVNGLTVSPLLTDQVRDVGADDYLRFTNAGLTLQTSWIDPVIVNLQLQCNRRQALDGSTFEGTTANLNLRAPLRLWDRSPPGLGMTASVGYRGMRGLANPAPDEGMSFRLTVDFQPLR
jgi:hypothetical protein